METLTTASLASLFDTPVIAKPKTLDTARLLRREAKRKFAVLRKEEELDAFLPTIESPYDYHIMSDGTFDFWTFITKCLTTLDTADEFYASTWVLNKYACCDMLDLYDSGKLKSIGLIVGYYFKARDTGIYTLISEGLQERKQRLLVMYNHAKVMLMCNKEKGIYISIAGSANFNANEQTEQFVISTTQDVYDFHREWMEEVLSK